MDTEVSRAPVHLSPVARLRIRIARMNGDSLSVVARSAGVTVRTVIKATSFVPRRPADRDQALLTLKKVTLREHGADPDADSLWCALLAAAGAIEDFERAAAAAASTLAADLAVVTAELAPVPPVPAKARRSRPASSEPAKRRARGDAA